MSEEEAINHLGTIAKSGSKDFMSEVQESDRKGSKFVNLLNIRKTVYFFIACKVRQPNQLLVSLELGSIPSLWSLTKLMFSPEGGMLKLEFIGHPMDREDIQLNLLRDFLLVHKLVSCSPFSTSIAVFL